MEKLTQNQRILRHFSDYGAITSAIAMTEYGIFRLASRVADLKKQGYNIKSTTKAGKNRYDETTHFSEYTLIDG